jgi:cysteine synthase
MNIGNSILDCIGTTPLVRLQLPKVPKGVEIWAKLEFMNPGGSVKDRVCLGILQDLEASGLLKPGDAIIEASAGNTAISLAMIAASRGYGVKVVMPDGVSLDRIRLVKAYGADVELTPTAAGMKASIARAREILRTSENAVLLDQFENPVNPRIHRTTTAMEIIEQLGRVPDAFVAGVGTGGTITGVGEAFKEREPNTLVAAVEPADSPTLSGGNPGPHGIHGIGAGFVPGILNMDVIDEVFAVQYSEALLGMKLMAGNCGIFAGLSSGAAVHAAVRLAQRLPSPSVIVTIFGDGGERYVSSDL